MTTAYLNMWRKAFAYTQEELSDKISRLDPTFTRNQSEISRVERDERRITIEWIDRYALALGIPAPMLFIRPPEDIRNAIRENGGGSPEKIRQFASVLLSVAENRNSS